MAAWNTFFDRQLKRANQGPVVFRKDGSEVRIGEDGSVSITANGSLTLASGNLSGLSVTAPLSLNDYQTGAMTTAIYHDKVIYPALGLAGEAGEVAGKVSKILRDSKGVLTDEVKKDLRKEIGDVLWFAAALAKDIDATLGEIAEENLAKLKSRKDRGVLGGSGDDR